MTNYDKIVKLEIKDVQPKIKPINQENIEKPQKQPIKQEPIQEEKSEAPTAQPIDPKKKKCMDCDKMIFKKCTRCLKCMNKHKIITNSDTMNRPSLEQLKNDLKELKSNLGGKSSALPRTSRSQV